MSKKAPSVLAHLVRRGTTLVSLLASGLLLVLFATMKATSSAGCSSVEVVPPPDAALPPCKRGPFTFSCQAPAPDQPSCNTENGKSSLLGLLPRNTEYSVGCVINLVGARDEQGDCRLESVCKCVLAETSTSVPEAGPPVELDAGDDAEAGPGPTIDAQARVSSERGAWLCDPP